MTATANPTPGEELIFLKLGGSVITDKSTPRTARPEMIKKICTEIKSALNDYPRIRILLGHGSGSFGHFSGSKFQTRQGVSSPEEWRGFAEVWQDASSLNQLVMDALHQAGLPGLAFPPSASVTSNSQSIQTWDLSPIRTALEKQLLPVVYGDVVFDTTLGGTILSTEDLFVHLAGKLKPSRILIAGLDPGVWKDFPACSALYQQISLSKRTEVEDNVYRSANTDVTGGMASKVTQMLDLIDKYPGLEVAIFSGAHPGNIYQALLGGSPGTLLKG